MFLDADLLPASRSGRLVATNNGRNTMLENITDIANALIAAGSLFVSYPVYRETKKDD